MAQPNEVASDPTKVGTACKTIIELEGIDVANLMSGSRAIVESNNKLYVLDKNSFALRDGDLVLWTKNSWGSIGIPGDSGRWIEECSYCPSGTGPGPVGPTGPAGEQGPPGQAFAGLLDYTEIVGTMIAPVAFTAVGVPGTAVPPPAGSTLLTLQTTPTADPTMNALEIEFSAAFQEQNQGVGNANFRIVVDNVLVANRGTGDTLPAGGTRAAGGTTIHKVHSLPNALGVTHNVTVQWEAPTGAAVTINPGADNQNATLSVRAVNANVV